jgi:hypothetical protein
MAFCGIIGVLIFLNVCIQAPGVLLHTAELGTWDAAFWEATLAYLVMTPIAIGLIAVAFRIRRHLRALDAKVEESESSK